MILGFVGKNLDFAVNEFAFVLGSCEILGLCWIKIDLTLQRMVLHWTRGSGTSCGRRKFVVFVASMGFELGGGWALAFVIFFSLTVRQ